MADEEDRLREEADEEEDEAGSSEGGRLGRKERETIYGAPVRAGKGRKSWLCLGSSRNTTRGAGSAHKAIPFCPTSTTSQGRQPSLFTTPHELARRSVLLFSSPHRTLFPPPSLTCARSVSPPLLSHFQGRPIHSPDQTLSQTRSDLHTLYSRFCSFKVRPALPQPHPSP